MIKRKKFNIYWIYLIIPIMLIVWNIFGQGISIKEVSWQTVKTQMLERGVVKEIVVLNDKVAQVYLKPDKIEEFKNKEEFKNIPTTGAQFEFRIGSLEKFETDFEAAQTDLTQKAEVKFEEKIGFWDSFLGSMFPLILMIGGFFLIMRLMAKGGGGGGGGNVFNVGKAKAQLFDKENKVSVNFNDVAGLEEAKVEIMEIVDFLKSPSKYSDLGGKIPKGALLVGPPGTGKTLLAKAVAGEANVPFFSISGSDFVEMFVGVGASRVRDLFAQAKAKAPCIVFIDEIDAIGRARSKNGGFSSNDERENTLNQLLTEMDGFGTNAGVIIIAATNRADILDKALLRAGRFDRQVHVELPDIKEREQIFKVHLKNIKLIPDFNTDFLAKQTPGFSGADIANVCNEAALIAARKNKKFVEKQDFLDAVDRIIGGLERKNKIITRKEKRTIAFHEAGHATASWMLEHANPLIKVTIIPRGKALGAAWYMPEERQITTKEQLMHEMSSLLGGRVSEELTFGEVSTGALNDLERATKMAYAMIAYYGMSDKIGNISFFDSTGGDQFNKPYSEKTATDIDSEAKAVVDEAYRRTKEILTEHKEGLERLAKLLLEKE
ncbi:MAG: ATP-dependent zinc metalloprotease FtsH, partial [Rikenellaceae bacterium]